MYVFVRIGSLVRLLLVAAVVLLIIVALGGRDDAPADGTGSAPVEVSPAREALLAPPGT